MIYIQLHTKKFAYNHELYFEPCAHIRLVYRTKEHLGSLTFSTRGYRIELFFSLVFAKKGCLEVKSSFRLATEAKEWLLYFLKKNPSKSGSMYRVLKRPVTSHLTESMLDCFLNPSQPQPSVPHSNPDLHTHTTVSMAFQTFRIHRRMLNFLQRDMFLMYLPGHKRASGSLHILFEE